MSILQRDGSKSGTPVGVPENEHYMQADLTIGNSRGVPEKEDSNLEGNFFKLKIKISYWLKLDHVTKSEACHWSDQERKKSSMGIPVKLFPLFRELQ